MYSSFLRILKCFFGKHDAYDWIHFKKEHFIEIGMRKIRYYDCAYCGKEFKKFI